MSLNSVAGTKINKEYIKLQLLALAFINNLLCFVLEEPKVKE